MPMASQSAATQRSGSAKDGGAMTGLRDKVSNDRPLRTDRPCRIAAAEADDAALRRICVKGTDAYARALVTAGYRLKAAPGLQDQEPPQ